jgi:hypothetical protein
MEKFNLGCRFNRRGLTRSNLPDGIICGGTFRDQICGNHGSSPAASSFAVDRNRPQLGMGTISKLNKANDLLFTRRLPIHHRQADEAEPRLLVDWPITGEIQQRRNGANASGAKDRKLIIELAQFTATLETPLRMKERHCHTGETTRYHPVKK